MKIILKPILALLLTAFSVITFAQNEPVNVRIMTDNDYKDFHIMFVAEPYDHQSPLEVGFHEAGGNLISDKLVKALSTTEHRVPAHIVAYMTKPSANQTIKFISKDDFFFSEGEQIGLSFPAMFQQK